MVPAFIVNRDIINGFVLDCGNFIALAIYVISEIGKQMFTLNFFRFFSIISSSSSPSISEFSRNCSVPVLM